MRGLNQILNDVIWIPYGAPKLVIGLLWVCVDALSAL